MFTRNHKHFELLAHAWHDRSLGDHHGLINADITGAETNLKALKGKMATQTPSAK